MHIQDTRQPPFAVFNTLPQTIAIFRNDQNSVVAEVTDHRSNKTTLATVNFSQVPESILLPFLNNPKACVKHLLKHSFIPIVHDDKVTFNTNAPASNDWVMDKTFKHNGWSITCIAYLPNGDLVVVDKSNISIIDPKAREIKWALRSFAW